jgi:SAM-dependent methyltransferase
VPQNIFVGRYAEGYDFASAEMYDPDLLDATVSFLVAEANGGPALEFGIGTGRVALPLSQRGVDVHGLDISADMIEQLRRKPGADAIPTTLGDFATTVVPGEFALVYVVFNSISCLLEQDEWVECFRNAACHLRAGGRFLIDLWVPDLRRFPPGALGVPFDVSDGHVGFDTIDVATQQLVSHHFFAEGEYAGRFESAHRYAWPAELDLMAQLAGLRLRERTGGWDRSPFTSDSGQHISIWEKPA